ncbi:hypothetical protein BB560_004176, partial [Smittium megazygosporum]
MDEKSPSQEDIDWANFGLPDTSILPEKPKSPSLPLNQPRLQLDNSLNMDDFASFYSNMSTQDPVFDFGQSSLEDYNNIPINDQSNLLEIDFSKILQDF